MSLYNIEMQDDKGNVMHPMTNTKAIFQDGKTQFAINTDTVNTIKSANDKCGSIEESLLQTNQNLETTIQDLANTKKSIETKADIESVEKIKILLSKVEENIIPPANSTKYRYVRCSAQSNSKSGNYVSYTEVKVMNGAINIAKNCNVIDLVGTIDAGKLSYVTDGLEQETNPGSCLDISSWNPNTSVLKGGITIDLGVPQSFQKIIVKHWVGDNRYYEKVKVEISVDKINWVTLYDNSNDTPIIETMAGRTIDVPTTTLIDAQKYNDYCFNRMNDNKNNPNVLRVATFNIHGDNYLNYEEYKDYITKNLIHVIGMQETEGGEYILNNKFNIYDLNRMANGKSATADIYNSIQSNRTIQSVEKTDLKGTGEARLLLKATMYINGKKVSIYNTHLSFTETANRPIQIEQIRQIMDSDPTPYKILTGDFNASNGDFYKLMGANYTSVQGYNGNWYETSYDDLTFYCIDNIFVTKNIIINKTVVNTNMMGSDHRMLWSELILN